MKTFSRQFPIKRINSRVHTTIIEGPNLFCQKSSFHSPNKKTSFKNANLVNVSKHQKVQSCFSFFALKKSFWRIIALQKSFCQKWLSRKKVRLKQWKKVSVAFCKKDWIWDNNNLCVAKKIARTKMTTKSKKRLESPFLLEERKKCNAAEVGRLSRIYSCLLFFCVLDR